MEERLGGNNHRLIVSNRNTIQMTGVVDVISFDTNEIVVDTEEGLLMIRGEDLHVNHLTLEKGAVGFTDDGVPIMDPELVREAMKRAKELNVPISFHEEDPALIDKAGVNKGKVSEELGFPGASRTADL